MASGESFWITGPAARADVQDLRARSSAVVSGRGTIAYDNPSLRVRPEQLNDVESLQKDGMQQIDESLEQSAQPMRVLLDTQASLSGAEKVFGAPGKVVHVSKRGLDLSESLLAALNTGEGDQSIQLSCDAEGHFRSLRIAR